VYVDPIAKPTEPAAEAAMTELEKKMMECEVVEYVRARRSRDEKKIELFGFMMTRMTDASVAVAAHKDWKELVLAKCPLQLWKAIQVNGKTTTKTDNSMPRVITTTSRPEALPQRNSNFPFFNTAQVLSSPRACISLRH
jgi:hypothetical protein